MKHANPCTEAHSLLVKMCVSKMSYVSYNYDSTMKNSLYDALISFSTTEPVAFNYECN